MRLCPISGTLTAMLALTLAAPASATTPDPPNQPVTYGDCVSTTAAGEGVEDLTVGLPAFTQLVGPAVGQRPNVDQTLACKGFSPPPGPQR